ncbi:Hypothetical protein DHA2_150073, partial [Giardia duodenalis]
VSVPLSRVCSPYASILELEYALMDAGGQLPCGGAGEEVQPWFAFPLDPPFCSWTTARLLCSARRRIPADIAPCHVTGRTFLLAVGMRLIVCLNKAVGAGVAELERAC